MIKRQYKAAFGFVRGNIWKTWWKCCLAFLVIMAAAAAAVSLAGYAGLERIMEYLDMMTGTAADGADSTATWYGFLVHNGGAGLANLVLGLVPFIPVNILVLIYNAVLLGTYTGVHSVIFEVPVVKSMLVGVAPHGIIEYAANCLSFALGLNICKNVTLKIRKKSQVRLASFIGECLRVFVLIVLPLLLVAGIIEAELTPVILEAYGM